MIGRLHELYKSSDQLERAVVALKSYLDSAPGDSLSRLRLANVYQLLEQNRDAISVYETLEKQIAENVMVLNNLAWLYWLEGDEKALKYAHKSYKLAPDQPEVIDTLGWIMLHKGDRKKALEHIQSAASSAPTNPEVRYHLAVALSKNGKNAQAIKELQRTLRDYPNFVESTAAKELLKQLRP